MTLAFDHSHSVQTSPIQDSGENSAVENHAGRNAGPLDETRHAAFGQKSVQMAMTGSKLAFEGAPNLFQDGSIIVPPLLSD
jgi:hypothetical protein